MIIKISPDTRTRSSDTTPDDPTAHFEAAIRRQIARLPGLGQDPETIEIQIGPRRILRVKGITIAGHAVALTGLDAHASIAVQVRNWRPLVCPETARGCQGCNVSPGQSSGHGPGGVVMIVLLLILCHARKHRAMTT